jgi:hypothetical protein
MYDYVTGFLVVATLALTVGGSLFAVSCWVAARQPPK